MKRTRRSLSYLASCWWSMPRARVFEAPLRREHERNLTMMRTSLSRMARVFGVPFDAGRA
jgi:hypothetical protein